MPKNAYLPRIVDKDVKRYLNTFGAVCLEGPKWCGKTRTAEEFSKSCIYLGDPSGAFQNRRLAQISPEAVLTGEYPRLIDEWQEVPPLWDAVRFAADQSSHKGLFLLTGSATPNHKGILHSGAGRIGRLRMRPMSLWESGDSSGKVSLEKLCSGKISSQMTGEVSLQELIRLILRGGWPAGLNAPLQHAQLMASEYIRAILDDDVTRIDGIERDRRKLELVLRSLARHESTTAGLQTIIRDIQASDGIELSRITANSYLDVFTRLFLLDNQRPFAPSVRSSARLKQAEKRHFCDPSLAAALLGVTAKTLMNDLETLGFLFESLCERDLRIYAESFGGSLYHYQDYQNREIDAVISKPDGSWCAFEIKLGAGQIDKAAENLVALKQSLGRDNKEAAPDVLCVLCGMSNAAYQRPDGVFVVPLTALKP